MPLVGTSGTIEAHQNSGVRMATLEFPVKSATCTVTNATTTSNNVTFNAAAGKITTEVLSTPGATEYVLTVTNSAVSASDLTFATLCGGSNTSGPPGISIARAVPGNGVLTLTILNENATTGANGTAVIAFMISKQETWPAP